ncbi:hypothetical protein EJ04DRAFT_525694 [Polyplosphaeria fusca]|uniref:Uncharacterized protein n=1 Tax=Polyplosphaeria fusca TaxID=682080 RepID=A0A9P4QW32_9PLEO|nr:hypothetical protein EJ04DRAFT_525694 [Polyplosphaeria fusca]
MVILGGLEIVVGGILIHKYHKNKHEKKRMQDEAAQRRHNTFPGAKPQSYPPQQQQQQPVHGRKYASYAPHPQPPPQRQPPPCPSHAMPQRRPLPHNHSAPLHFQPEIRPVGRQDSFATLSSMPVANGSQPTGMYSQMPPQPLYTNPYTSPYPAQTSQQLAPIRPYSNAGFSVSTPAFHPSPITPVHTSHPAFGRNTVDDNWEAYEEHPPHVRFDGSDSPHHDEREDEDDPPPPYRP